MSTAPIPLIPKVIEPLMQLTTLTMLGIDFTSDEEHFDAAMKRVRVGWQTTGQPASSINEDVVYVRAVEDDDEYNRIRDVEVADVLPEPATEVDLITRYTRVWRVFWTIYGPNSFDAARQIRSQLFTQEIHDLLLTGFPNYGELGFGQGGYGGQGYPLYLVTDIAAPRRVPEIYGAQWWERVDFDCQFNEGTTETDRVNAVKSVEVIIENADGVQEDFTVSTP